MELRAQRPFAKGLSFLAAYAWNHERIQETLDDLARYRVLTSGGEDGWEWRPTDSPVHRFTTAVTWQVPIGRDRAFLSSLPAALDYAIGGWQYTAAMRYYSGRPLIFGNFVVDGNPKLDDPTRDRWFDTSRFSVQDAFTPRNNPSFYDSLNGPAAFFADMTLTKVFRLGPRYRVGGAPRGLQRVQHDRLGQPRAQPREPELRQGDAQAHRRPGPRDPDRRALRVLAAPPNPPPLAAHLAAAGPLRGRALSPQDA